MKPKTQITVVGFVGVAVAVVLLGAVACAGDAAVKPPSEAKTEVYQAHLVLETEAPKPSTTLDSREVALIARTIWGEAECVSDTAEQAAVAWCILNRVDAWNQTIEEVVTAPNQFVGFYRNNGDECPKEYRYLAADVMNRWKAEKRGFKNVGRVLPADYLYFTGDGTRNYFTTTWPKGESWDWSLPTPYDYKIMH